MSLHSKSHPVGSCVRRSQEGISDNELIKSWISHSSCPDPSGADRQAYCGSPRLRPRPASLVPGLLLLDCLKSRHLFPGPLKSHYARL